MLEIGNAAAGLQGCRGFGYYIARNAPRTSQAAYTQTFNTDTNSPSFYTRASNSARHSPLTPFRMHAWTHGCVHLFGMERQTLWLLGGKHAARESKHDSGSGVAL